MVLLNDVIEIFDLTNHDWDFPGDINLIDRRFVGATFIHGDFFRDIVPAWSCQKKRLAVDRRARRALPSFPQDAGRAQWVSRTPTNVHQDYVPQKSYPFGIEYLVSHRPFKASITHSKTRV